MFHHEQITSQTVRRSELVLVSLSKLDAHSGGHQQNSVIELVKLNFIVQMLNNLKQN